LSVVVQRTGCYSLCSQGNLGFIFDQHLIFSDQISALSLSLNLAIIIFVNFAAFVNRPYLDFTTACTTVATDIVHSKLDYCNSLYHNIPQSEIKRLQNNSGGACFPPRWCELLVALPRLPLRNVRTVHMSVTQPIPVVDNAYRPARRFLLQITLGRMTPTIPNLAKAMGLLYLYLVGLR